uniref:RING-type E3 ubiquitin transferase n=1 Tax=Accipiter nisus TaxID=211598 RepID=A0A8B9N9B0_9AVES
MTPAAAAAVRGRGLSFPAPRSPPQHMESMATELVNHCPICLDSWEEASYVMPCLQQFCYTCILRWAESKPECPLCKGRLIVVHLTGGGPGHPATHRLHHAPAPWSVATGPLLGAPVGGFHAYVWVFLFCVYPTVLHPLGEPAAVGSLGRGHLGQFPASGESDCRKGCIKKSRRLLSFTFSSFCTIEASQPPLLG